MSHISMMFDTEGYYRVAVEKNGEVQLLPGLNKDRSMCTLRLLRGGKILVGSIPDDTDEGAASYNSLHEIIDAGTKRIACFFRKAIYDAQAFCGQSVDVIVLVVSASLTNSERLKLHAAASMINVDLRLMYASEALAISYALDLKLKEHDEEFFGTLHMDHDSIEVAAFDHSQDVMELVDIYTGQSPLQTLVTYVKSRLKQELSRIDNLFRIPDLPMTRIAYRMLMLTPHDFPYEVDLQEIIPAASGTVSFTWDSISNAIGNFHIADLIQTGTYNELDTSRFLLLVNGFDYRFPLLEALIEQQNRGGITLFCREEPYALLGAYRYASKFLGKRNLPHVIITATSHALYLGAGSKKRILLADCPTSLPTKKTIEITIDPKNRRSVGLVVYEGETPILYAPIPLPRKTATYTLTLEDRIGSHTAHQNYLTAYVASESGETYNLLPCEDALIPCFADDFGPVITPVDREIITIGEAATYDPLSGDTQPLPVITPDMLNENASEGRPHVPSFQDGDTIELPALRTNQDRMSMNVFSIDALASDLKRMLDCGVTDAASIRRWLLQVDPQ